MRDHLTQKELDQEFYGTPPTVVVQFEDNQVVDVARSRELGQKTMKSQVYIRLECEKERVKTFRPASDQDKQAYRGAWMKYQQEKESGRLRQVSNDEQPCSLIGSEGIS
jgi:hypothetical protein